MNIFHFQKTPVVPPHCLWVAGLLLESGCRASAGVSCLYRARHTAGNRLAMGDKMPGAWGAPGIYPFSELGTELASNWAEGGGNHAKNCQMEGGSVSVHAMEFLFDGNVAHRAPLPTVDERTARPELSDAAHVASGKTSPARGGTNAGAGEEVPLKKKVLFIPKPEPWRSNNAYGAPESVAGKVPSFCGRIVTFSPTLSRGF